MRLNRSVVVASALALATLAARPARTRESTAEIQRIRTHFDSVLAGLASRDVSALTIEQRARRASLVVTLRAYQARGVFPHYYDCPDAAVPYFVDRKTGTLCAVAHLLASTGRRDIVDRVAHADNNVWVHQLAGDSAFTHWLGDNGLTLDEAAFIQVPYVSPTSKAEEVRNTGFVVAAPFALGGALATSLWNASGNSDGHSTSASTIGVVSGLATTAMGALVLSKPDFNRGIGASSIAVGLTSVALSLRSMRNHSTMTAEREAEKARTMAQTAVVPMVSVSNGGSAGVAVSMRF
jgi:hypothetical protein